MTSLISRHPGLDIMGRLTKITTPTGVRLYLFISIQPNNEGVKITHPCVWDRFIFYFLRMIVGLVGSMMTLLDHRARHPPGPRRVGAGWLADPLSATRLCLSFGLLAHSAQPLGSRKGQGELETFSLEPPDMRLCWDRGKSMFGLQMLCHSQSGSRFGIHKLS